MDDLSQKLSAMLKDPNIMSQVQSVLNSMGGGNSAPQQSSQSNPVYTAPPASSGPAPSSGTSGPPASGPSFGNLAGILGGLDMNTLGLIAKLAPMMQSFQTEDNSTRLLHALRPMLSEARQKKLDEAVRLLQMMRMLPVLKSSGILGNLGNLGNLGGML